MGDQTGLVSILIIFILFAIGTGLYFAIDQLLALKEAGAAAAGTGTGTTGTGTGTGTGTIDQNPFVQVGSAQLTTWTDPSSGPRIIDILGGVLEIVADLLGSRLAKLTEEVEARRQKAIDEAK